MRSAGEIAQGACMYADDDEQRRATAEAITDARLDVVKRLREMVDAEADWSCQVHGDGDDEYVTESREATALRIAAERLEAEIRAAAEYTGNNCEEP